jgi:hypothetical protein
MQLLPGKGIDLVYIEQGAGTFVVFVHGAWMDFRYWEPTATGDCYAIPVRSLQSPLPFGG